MNERKKAKILIVDDDRLLLELLSDTLEAIGYESKAAPGGVEALECLTEDTFDLLITDVKMPDLDGIQLLKKVRRHYPDLPVLFITGVATPEVIGRSHPDGFLAKPFRISHIEDLIETTLRTKGQEFKKSLRKVLIVENDQNYRDLLLDTLNYSFYIPFSVTDEQSAVRELQQGHFDVIVTNYRETSPAGSHFLENVRKSYPDTSIILTGENLNPSEMKKQLDESLVDGFLNKPFGAAEMLELLNQVSETPLAGGFRF